MFPLLRYTTRINGIEPNISGELVREIAGIMEATIRHLDATMPDLLPGYRVKIIDGNAICASQQRFAIAASEHRLKELRQISSAPLPGQYEGCTRPKFNAGSRCISMC